MFIIDDSTPHDVLFPKDQERGLEVESPGFGTVAGYDGYATEFPSELLIPESEWIPRIREIESRKSDLKTLAYDRHGVKIKNQSSLPYCWMFATTSCLEVQRAVQGQPHVALSPGSTGSWVTGFRRRGGWGREALQGLRERGAVPSSDWPDTAVDRRYDTEANREKAARYKADEWWIVPDWPTMVSCLLRGIPVSAGYNWWRHQVLGLWLAVVDGEVCPGIANSWSESWGDQGFGYLQGRRKMPDDAVAIRTAMPTS